jgi:hypothetical protein
MSFVGKAIDSLTGANKAADASTAGAQISADAANRALDYLKEEEAIPQFFRKGSLNIIGGLSGLGDMAGQDAVSKIKNSEIYKQVMGSKMAGEDAILRNASVTGGLRSGNTSDALARYSGDLEQQAFFQGLKSLQGLAQLPSNANNIAAATADVGDILGQGRVASGQAIASGRGALTAGLLGAAGSFAGSAGGQAAISRAFSDTNLKKNIQKISEKGEHNWYRWDWAENAAQFGLHGSSEGVLAQEVLGINPNAVGSKDGYLTVNYETLGLL